MRWLLLLLCLLTVATKVWALGCTREFEAWCAMSSCSQCSIINNLQACDTIPLNPSNETVCYQPCAKQVRACTWYTPLTPASSILVAHCNNVTDLATCNLVSAGEPNILHGVGTYCVLGQGPSGLVQPSLTLAASSFAYCSGGYTYAQYADGVGTMYGICVPSSSYVNLPAAAGTYYWTELQTTVCFVHQASPVMSSSGLVISFGNPYVTVDSDLLTAACARCWALPDGATLDSSCSNDPNSRQYTSVPYPVVANRIMGYCQAGRCASVWQDNPPNNNQCTDGWCRANATSTAYLDADNPANWPTASCGPTCPGFPSCPILCTGLPNFADAPSYIRAQEVTSALPSGDRCFTDDACAPIGICQNFQCQQSAARHYMCRQAGCRECNPRTGRCDPNMPSAFNTPCAAGCSITGQGTCDGNLHCDVVASFTATDCLARQGLTTLTATDQQCWNASCTNIIPPWITQWWLQQSPLVNTPGVVLSLAAEYAGTLALMPSLMRYTCNVVQHAVGSVCSDLNACTVGETCSATGHCVAAGSIDSWCTSTHCMACNQTTGLCTEPIVGASCFSGCGVPSTDYLGACSLGECIATPTAPTACIQGNDSCTSLQCVSVFTGSPIVKPLGVDLVYGDLNPSDLSATCQTVLTPDGTACFTQSSFTDRCIFFQHCISGGCVIAQNISCDSVVSSLPCASNATQCNHATGFCEVVPLANGTSCDDGDACTLADTCYTPGVPNALPVCAGGMTVSCASLAAQPCVVSAICNHQTGNCDVLYANPGTPCNIFNASAPCPLVGVCTTNGLCVVPGSYCAQPPQSCLVAECVSPGGACVNNNVPNGHICSDGSACTSGDVCLSGSCIGSPIVCTPLSVCQAVVGCSPGTGCVFVNVADGTPCSLDHVCITGVCISLASLSECSGSDCPNATTTSLYNPLEVLQSAGETAAVYAGSGVMSSFFAMTILGGLFATGFILYHVWCGQTTPITVVPA